jgi:hypothetical protein
MNEDQFQTRVADAERVGLELMGQLDRSSMVARKEDQVFVLFYNHAQATDCDRDYLIQRIKLSKTSFDAQGVPLPERDTYLVEVMKLNNHKKTKKPDEHRKNYFLRTAARRLAVTNYEIGCGEIPGVADGDAWPYEATILYKRLQDYQENAGLYNQVQFDDSITYQLEVEFDDEGGYRVALPSFVPRETDPVGYVQPLSLR